MTCNRFLFAWLPCYIYMLFVVILDFILLPFDVLYVYSICHPESQYLNWAAL